MAWWPLSALCTLFNISFSFYSFFLISLCHLVATKRLLGSRLDIVMFFGISYLTKTINIFSTWINSFNLDNTLSFHESVIFLLIDFVVVLVKCALKTTTMTKGSSTHLRVCSSPLGLKNKLILAQWCVCYFHLRVFCKGMLKCLKEMFTRLKWKLELEWKIFLCIWKFYVVILLQNVGVLHCPCSLD